MAIWQDALGNYYDDDNRKALTLPGWSKNLTQYTGAWPPAPTLPQAQAAQIVILKTAYQNAIQLAVSYTSQGGVTKTFQADKSSQDDLAKMLDAYRGTGVVPTGFYWVAADNTQVAFTYADMQGLAAEMGNQGWTAFQHLQVQKAAVNAATTVAAVQAIVW